MGKIVYTFYDICHYKLSEFPFIINEQLLLMCYCVVGCTAK